MTITTAGIDHSRWIHEIRVAAQEAGCESRFGPRLQQLLAPPEERAVIGLVGAPNCGKSSLLNLLLGRTLVPVSPLPSRLQLVIRQRGAEGGEYFVLNGVRYPLTGVTSTLRDAASVDVELSVENEWTSRQNLRLIEKRAVDAAPEELVAALDDALSGLDLVVPVIDAMAPLRRSDAMLLSACRQRRLPLVIAVMKTRDLPPARRDESMEYIRQYVHDVDPGIPIIEGERDEGARSICDSITRLISESDIDDIRTHQAERAMLSILDELRSVARQRVDATATAVERQEATEREKNDLRSADEKQWLQIEVALLKRRRRVDERTRAELRAGEASIINNLLLDLNRSNDVKGWWRNELAYRLEQELSRVCSSASATAERQIADDLSWLIEEVRRRFSWPVALDGGLSAITTHVPAELPAEPGLSSTSAVKLITMAGSTVALIVGGGILFAGGGVALAVASVLTGGAAELYSRFATNKDRTKARAAIEPIVTEAREAYAANISARLTVGYDDILISLKQGRLGWQLSQGDSGNEKTSEESTAAADLLSRINQLSAQIAGHQGASS